MKCWNLAFNAQDSRVIVEIGAVEALRKKERGVNTGWNSIYHPKNGVPSPPPLPPPLLNAHVHLFSWVFLISAGFGPNSGFWCCVFLTVRIPLLWSPPFVAISGQNNMLEVQAYFWIPILFVFVCRVKSLRWGIPKWILWSPPFVTISRQTNISEVWAYFWIPILFVLFCIGLHQRCACKCI